MKTLFGGILIGIGVLIAGASGLCSLAFVISMTGRDGGGEFASLRLVLVMGGVPFGVGISLFLLGRSMIRSDREDEPH